MDSDDHHEKRKQDYGRSSGSPDYAEVKLTADEFSMANMALALMGSESTISIAAGTIHYGMQTFDQSLLVLYKNGYITYDEALMTASNPDDFILKVKGIQSTSDLTWEAEDKGKSDTKPGDGTSEKQGGGTEFKIDRFGDK